MMNKKLMILTTLMLLISFSFILLLNFYCAENQRPEIGHIVDVKYHRADPRIMPGETLEIEGEVTDPDGQEDIKSYYWEVLEDCGEINPAHEMVTVFTGGDFEGRCPIKLTVEDEEGLKGERTVWVLVSEFAGLGGDVRNVQIEETDRQISLSWENPTENEYYVETVLCYSTDGYPYSPPTCENELVRGSDTSFVHTDLTNNTEYFYSFFTVDSFDHYTQPIEVSGTPINPPQPVLSFTADPSLYQITLNWQMPDQYSLKGVVIKRSKEDFPQTKDDGEEIYKGTANTFTDTQLDYAQTYYYSIFTYDDFNLFSSKKTVSATTDTLEPITNFSAQAVYNQATLSWTPSVNTDRIMIRRSTNGFPEWPQDGQLVYSGTGNTYTDTNLEVHTPYYYTAFSFDQVPNYSPPVNAQVVTKYSFTTYNRGLKSENIYNLFINEDGHIYLGTAEGFSFSTSNGNSYTNSAVIYFRVNSIDVDNGVIYIGTHMGVAKSANGGTVWTQYSQGETGLASDVVYSISVEDEVIYAGTAAGLSISYDGGESWSNITADSHGIVNNKINSLKVLDGVIYLGTSNGLSISEDAGETWENFTKASNGMASNYINFITIHNDKIYLGTDNGISISSNGGSSWINFNRENNGLVSNEVNSIAINDRKNTILVGTDKGLSISTDNGQTWPITYTTADGLGSDEVKSVALYDGRIYLGTWGGLSIIDL